jgi:uncharacterized glyoxalase superfamily protein PhnB
MLNNRSMPASTVIPVIHYLDVNEAIDWLCSAFGFTLRLRIGDHRAQLQVEGGCIVVAQGKSVPGALSIMVRIADACQHRLTAMRWGARCLSSPTDYPYGERQYDVEDFAGYRWTFSESIADVDPSAWGGTLVSG